MSRQISPLADLWALWQLWRLLRRIRPQIVHSHTPKGGLLGMSAAWLAGTPIRIYHLRGLPLMTARGPRRWILRTAERVSCGLAQRVLCVSRSLADYVAQEGICPADKMRVLCSGSGNGVDAEVRFTPTRFPDDKRRDMRRRMEIPDGALVVGFVGRMVRDKGMVELISAWNHLRSVFPQAYLLFVGRREQHDPLPPKIVQQVEQDPRIRLAGPVSEPAEFYAIMDLVVLPTYREGFPNVPLEAAAMQLPVVAARATGCVDAIQDGVTGSLVPVGSVNELSNAMARYLADADLRRRHGAAARERVLRDFKPELIWRAVHQEYAELLALSSRTATPCPLPPSHA